MENGLYIGLSRQMALQKRMDLVANNIANVNTPGYRADKMLFEEYVLQTDTKDREELSMVLDYGQFKDTAMGKMTHTGNPLDVALDGPAFMMVETGEGTKYTRAGNFTLNNEGVLVTPAGNPVLDNGEGQITIPEGVKEIKITDNGQIITDQGAVGQIGMMEFENVNMLRSTGDGYYRIEGDMVGQPAEGTRMRQNMVEGSNVQAVLEMTDLIEISRPELCEGRTVIL